MNKFSTKVTCMVVSIAIFSILAALTLVTERYWLFAIFLLIFICISYKLYRLNIKTTHHFSLFIESIKFLDNNILFKNRLTNDIYTNYYNALNSSLQKLNMIIQKRESEINFYTNLLNRIDFGLIVVDDKDDIVWINKMAMDMLGRPKPESMKGLSKISEDLFEAFQNLQAKTTKTILIPRDGKMKNIAINLSSISVQNNHYKIYSLKDVQPVIEEAESSAWQQLISVLTHEMMNSLTPIISLSETLSNADAVYDGETMEKAMSTIHRRSKGLVSFVNNYKKLTQIPPLQKEVISVKLLIEDIVELFKMQDINVKYIITSERMTINVDRAQMEQVLINLIKNAWEANLDNPEPDIRIAALEEANGQIVISISDNGDGIDPEIAEKIFMPFYSTKVNGSGIGLSICRQIINMHGGTITALSMLDERNTFTIRL